MVRTCIVCLKEYKGHSRTLLPGSVASALALHVRAIPQAEPHAFFAHDACLAELCIAPIQRCVGEASDTGEYKRFLKFEKVLLFETHRKIWGHYPVPPPDGVRSVLTDETFLNKPRRQAFYFLDRASLVTLGPIAVGCLLPPPGAPLSQGPLQECLFQGLTMVVAFNNAQLWQEAVDACVPLRFASFSAEALYKFLQSGARPPLAYFSFQHPGPSVSYDSPLPFFLSFLLACFPNP